MFTKPNIIPLDIMDEHADRFICDMRYPVSRLSELFPIKGTDIMDFIYGKRPSLRNRKITVMIGTIPLRPHLEGDLQNFQILYKSNR